MRYYLHFSDYCRHVSCVSVSSIPGKGSGELSEGKLTGDN